MLDDSILDTIRPMIGGIVDDTEAQFETDLIIHINTALSILTQLGVGPSSGFSIEDNTATWTDFIGDCPDLSAVKSYVYMRTLLLFDPGRFNTGLVNAMQDRLKEMEWRLNVAVETPSGKEDEPSEH